MKAIILSLITLAFAHGEDKPGPHGGVIRMPGTFHTEIVSKSAGVPLKVYLLDLDWKNPSVKNAAVSVVYNDTLKQECVAKSDHFECPYPAKMAKGPTATVAPSKLKLSAKREGVQGQEVEYNLGKEGVQNEPPPGMESKPGANPHH